jgi:hypothetical protein
MTSLLTIPGARLAPDGALVFLTGKGRDRTSKYHPPVKGLRDWQLCALVDLLRGDLVETQARAYAALNWIAGAPPRKSDGVVIRSVSSRTMTRVRSLCMVEAGPGAYRVGPWIVTFQAPRRVRVRPAEEYVCPPVLYRPAEYGASAVYVQEAQAGTLAAHVDPETWETGADEAVDYQDGEISDWMDRECEDCPRGELQTLPVPQGEEIPPADDTPPLAAAETRPAWFLVAQNRASTKGDRERKTVETGLRAMTWLMDHASKGGYFGGELPRAMRASLRAMLAIVADRGADRVYYLDDYCFTGIDRACGRVEVIRLRDAA